MSYAWLCVFFLSLVLSSAHARVVVSHTIFQMILKVLCESTLIHKASATRHTAACSVHCSFLLCQSPTFYSIVGSEYTVMSHRYSVCGRFWRCTAFATASIDFNEACDLYTDTPSLRRSVGNVCVFQCICRFALKSIQCAHCFWSAVSYPSNGQHIVLCMRPFLSLFHSTYRFDIRISHSHKL